MSKKTCLTLTLLFLSSCCATILCTAGAAFCQTIDDCIECHMDINLTKTADDGTTRSLYVNKGAFIRSVHGEMDYTCVDCHEGVEADNHPAGGIPDVDCAECHEEAAQEYAQSFHGKALSSGNDEAPRCYDCHTIHEVLYSDNPDSSIHPDNLITTCGACHDQQVSFAFSSVFSRRVKAHGKVNLSRAYTTKRCAYCHPEVMNHSTDEYEPAVCADCHASGKNSLIFGTIHSGTLTEGPALSILIFIFYSAGIACIAWFLKNGQKKSRSTTTGESQ